MKEAALELSLSEMEEDLRGEIGVFCRCEGIPQSRGMGADSAGSACQSPRGPGAGSGKPRADEQILDGGSRACKLLLLGFYSQGHGFNREVG